MAFRRFTRFTAPPLALSFARRHVPGEDVQQDQEYYAHHKDPPVLIAGSDPRSKKQLIDEPQTNGREPPPIRGESVAKSTGIVGPAGAIV